MSRHLMAKFRRQASVEWQTGPTGWRDWAIEPEDPEDAKTVYFGEPWRQHNFPEEHSSAIVHHGEQRHALNVMPVRSVDPRPGKTPPPLRDGDTWAWAIFKHDHNKSPLPWRFPADWASEIADSSPAKYYGFTSTAEDARREAEENWELHKQHAGHGMGSYDLDAIMRDHEPRSSKPSYHIDDDFGDIFGGV